METGNPPSKRIVSSSSEEGHDRLSSLPDAVILHILSLLDDTRSAARTSVLATRWRRLWTSLDDLSFDAKSFDDCFDSGHHSAFENFVRSVLLARDKNRKVDRFRFSLSDRFFCNRYNSLLATAPLFTWTVKYAADHGVNHLILHNCKRGKELVSAYVYPEIFTCQALKTLELRWFSQLSRSCRFTTITTLLLENCSLVGLKVDLCVDVLAIFPNLTNLTIISLDLDCDLKIWGPKLVNLRLENVMCADLKLSAPELLSFKCQMLNWIRDVSVVHLPSLLHAEVEICSDQEFFIGMDKFKDFDFDWLTVLVGPFWKVYSKLLFGLQNVEFLKLYVGPFKVFHIAGFLEHQTCCFSKLKSLKMLVKPDNGCVTVPEEVKTYLLSGTPHSQDVHIQVESL